MPKPGMDVYKHAVQVYAEQEGITFHDALKFLSRRRTVEAALELLGFEVATTLINTASMKKAKPLVYGFKKFLLKEGFTPPNVDYEGSVSYYVYMDKDADISEDVRQHEISRGVKKKTNGGKIEVR